MQIVIDRFEGKVAVVELPDGSLANVDARILKGFSEGDVLSLLKDDAETEKRKERAKRTLAELFGN